jgi:hypothetical protein
LHQYVAIWESALITPQDEHERTTNTPIVDAGPLADMRNAGHAMQRACSPPSCRARLSSNSTCKGRVLTANQLFLDAVGYTLPEIVGQPHRMFCKADLADSENTSISGSTCGPARRAAASSWAEPAGPAGVAGATTPILGDDGLRQGDQVAHDITSANCVRWRTTAWWPRCRVHMGSSSSTWPASCCMPTSDSWT